MGSYLHNKLWWSFEQAYQDYGIKSKAITNSKDKVKYDKEYNKYQIIYKSHGCINNLHSVIISEDDYQNYQINKKALYKLLAVKQDKKMVDIIEEAVREYLNK